jgi:hypothetical protein
LAQDIVRRTRQQLEDYARAGTSAQAHAAT